MKRQILFVGSVVLFFTLHAPAQTAPTTPSNTTPNQSAKANANNADVAITATVTARELKFEVVPNPIVEFPGSRHERATVWEADRQNLPKPVEPGVTYRNIGIELRIVSRFADIDRIVAEALGEIPVADENRRPTEMNQPATNANPEDQPKQIAKSTGKNKQPRGRNRR